MSLVLRGAAQCQVCRDPSRHLPGESVSRDGVKGRTRSVGDSLGPLPPLSPVISVPSLRFQNSNLTWAPQRCSSPGPDPGPGFMDTGTPAQKK